MSLSTQKENEPKLLFGRGYNVNFDQFAQLLHIVGGQLEGAPAPSSVADALGLTSPKTQGLIGLARGFGLLDRKSLLPTDLGQVVAEKDPFFDDLGTLWLLHYVVSSEPRQLVWNRFVNQLIPQQRRFTMQNFRDVFEDQRSKHAAYSGNRHILYETLTVIEAYTKSNLSRLAYLRKDGEFYTIGYLEVLPPLVLAAAIARFRDRHRPGSTAISVPDLLSVPNSPGVVFQLDEGRLRTALEQLKTQRGFSLESRADLDQIRLTDNTPDYAWMERYYADR